MALINFDPIDGEYLYNQSGVIPINTVLFDFDTGRLPAGVDLILHLAAIGTSGVITAQGSNFDGADFVPLWTEQMDNATSPPGTTRNSSGVYLVPTITRYVRITLTGATTAGVTRAKVYTCGNGQRKAIVIAAGGVGIIGQAGHDSPVNGFPVRVSGRARATNWAAVAADDTSDLLLSLTGQLINKPFSIPELDWQYPAASGGIVNTADVAIKAAVAGVRNYITRIDLWNRHATVATEVVLKDGATVIWRGLTPANMLLPVVLEFTTPLKGSVNSAISVACTTTGSAVYVNASGYTA